MRRAFVHIGMPKTGSTTIQNTMSAARTTLQDHGLIYPGTGPDHAVLIAPFHKDGAGHFYLKNKGISKDQAARDFERFTTSLRAQTQGFDGDLLLSSEYLYQLGRPALGKLDAYFTGLGFEMTIVCYVRHPLAGVTSQIQQRVKMNGRSLADMLAEPRWGSIKACVHPALLELGRDRIMVRSLEAARPQGVARDILQAIAYKGPVQDIPNLHANTSLSGPAIYGLDWLNRQRFFPPKFRAKLRQNFLKLPGRKFSLPKETRALFAPQAQADLAWLKDTFDIDLPAPK